MQALPKWRNVFLFKNPFVQSTAATAHLASFHSTPISLLKWKNKWNSDEKRDQPPPAKTYIRYATRQKRADAKRALNNLLFHSGSFNGRSYNITFEEESPKAGGPSRWDGYDADNSGRSNMKGRSKSSAHRASKAHQKKMKHKSGTENLFEDFNEFPGTSFHATLGNRCYTWSFKSSEESFQSSTTGFEWRDDSKWTKSKYKEWDTASGTESDDESCVVGSCSDRAILGLPPKGPLKIEDVKNAFRLSALKWHPDKHQGPSQATAEEIFKKCVDAYKSLCNALS